MESKTVLKTKLRKEQKKKCAISGQKLKKETKLFDAGRIKPKREGGLLRKRNVRALEPVTNMKHHNIHRERNPELTYLKMLIDSREQLSKLVFACSNRLDAKKRKTDQLDPETKAWLQATLKEGKSRRAKLDRKIKKSLLAMNLPIIHTAIAIRGVGPITIAYCMIYLQIEKANNCSSFWAYVGYDKPAHQRYEKGRAGGGNKTLRTALYACGESFIKQKNVYSAVYNAEKQKLAASKRLVESYDTTGKKRVTVMWKDAKPCHRHGAAVRKMMKHFLADLWFVWRTYEGLDTRPLYVQEKMGHDGIVQPEERGWKFITS